MVLLVKACVYEKFPDNPDRGGREPGCEQRLGTRKQRRLFGPGCIRRTRRFVRPGIGNFLGRAAAQRRSDAALRAFGANALPADRHLPQWNQNVELSGGQRLNRVSFNPFEFEQSKQRACGETQQCKSPNPLD